MVMKVMALGQTRLDAIGLLSAALGQVEIEGITTNKDYLRAIITHPRFQSAELSTSFLDAHHDELIAQATPSSEMAKA
jgi:3-methylcrotonyl-CoA carboxylase alpha subunit